MLDARAAVSVNDVARPQPADEGSPARLIAAMVGIVGILLLGSLAWSAVGALLTALGETVAAVSSPGTPAPKLLAGTPAPAVKTTLPALTPTVGLTPTPVDKATQQPLVLTPTANPVATPEPAITPTPEASGRAPWILLPLPAPGARVPPGAQVIEARGRGDTAITAIKLELDGAALGVSLEQRSESTWRGSSTTQVGAGHHAVRATVIDDQGRTGSFRWTFDAGP